jgi:hypothetical protein
MFPIDFYRLRGNLFPFSPIHLTHSFLYKELDEGGSQIRGQALLMSTEIVKITCHNLCEGSEACPALHIIDHMTSGIGRSEMLTSS